MADLRKYTRECPETLFDLDLGEGGVLQKLQPVRAVPDKRLVCRGVWQGKPVFTKIFIGDAARRYAERDATGFRLLQDAGVDTPELLFSGVAKQLDGSEAHVLIYAAIESGLNAESLWSELDANGRFSLAAKLVAIIAQHHRAGLLQTDLYLKNFLVDEEKIYTIDGDGIRRLPRFRRRAAEEDNLAMLLSKFDVLETDAWMPALLQNYAKHRMGQAAPDAVRLDRRVAYFRRKAVSAYAEKKVFRQCTDVVVWQSWRKFLAITRSSVTGSLAQMLRDMPDSLVDDIKAKRLKSGNTCTVSLVQIDELNYVVKRYNIKSFRHWLSRFWRPSRAASSWVNAHRLLMYNISTPLPVALLEYRYGPVRDRAYFVAHYVDAPDLAEWLGSRNVTESQKRAGMKALARLIHKLQRLQIVHGDLKASNIRMVDTEPMLIDLDSMRELRCRALFERGHVRDLKRLLRNWEEQSWERQELAKALVAEFGESAMLQRVMKY
jgi:tRNA A-37 threonylcarbamoyl transferase component Bud32